MGLIQVTSQRGVWSSLMGLGRQNFDFQVRNCLPCVQQFTQIQAM